MSRCVLCECEHEALEPCGERQLIVQTVEQVSEILPAGEVIRVEKPQLKRVERRMPGMDPTWSGEQIRGYKRYLKKYGKRYEEIK